MSYHKVVSIQECPGRMARVTFEAGGETSKKYFEDEGKVIFLGVECPVVVPPPPPPPVTTVVVYWYPYEGPDSAVESALSAFGTVMGVRNQSWSGRPSVSTGSKVAKMVLKKEIPRFITINGVRCKVWYKGQPLRCDICRSEEHKAATCPARGKCLRCLQPGHHARQCPTVTVWGTEAVPSVPGGTTVPSVPAPELGDEALNGVVFEDSMQIDVLNQAPPPPPGDDSGIVDWSEVVVEGEDLPPPPDLTNLNTLGIIENNLGNESSESSANATNLNNNGITENNVDNESGESSANATNINSNDTLVNNSSYISDNVLTPGGNLAVVLEPVRVEPPVARTLNVLPSSDSDTDTQDESELPHASAPLISSSSATPDELSDSGRSRS
ncbi:hypothetical protein AWC38_SpisGene19218, partial [Stylophora pistillata]